MYCYVFHGSKFLHQLQEKNAKFMVSVIFSSRVKEVARIVSKIATSQMYERICSSIKFFYVITLQQFFTKLVCF